MYGLPPTLVTNIKYLRIMKTPQCCTTRPFCNFTGKPRIGVLLIGCFHIYNFIYIFVTFAIYCTGLYCCTVGYLRLRNDSRAKYDLIPNKKKQCRLLWQICINIFICEHIWPRLRLRFFFWSVLKLFVTQLTKIINVRTFL